MPFSTLLSPSVPLGISRRLAVSFGAIVVVAATAFTPAATAVTAGDWPQWRGPAGTGASAKKDLTVTWSATDNVVWRVDLPERGNGSPIIHGDRAFIGQGVGSENRRTVMCFDRKSGKLLWQSGVTYTEREPTQRNNPYRSATPATDGERVIASFGSAGLFCYDLDGKELWRPANARGRSACAAPATAAARGRRCCSPMARSSCPTRRATSLSCG